MMNILMFAPYAGSRQHGMILRNYVLACGFIELGHTVTIVSSSFAHTRIQQPRTSGYVTRELIDGIEYLWIKGPQYKQSGVLGRVFSMLLYTLQCWRLKPYFKNNFDVVIASSPHPFSIYPAKYYAKKFSAKLIYDIRDLWPLTLIQLGGYSSKHPFIKLMQKAEDYACKYADLIIAVPYDCFPYLKERGLSEEKKFLPIGNGVLSSYINADLNPLPLNYSSRLAQLKKKGAFLICYTGAIGLANALYVLIQALPHVPFKIEVIILGTGAQKEELQLLAKDLDVSDRVHFFKPLNKDQVISFINYADVCYIGSLLQEELYKYGVSPTKMNDYMLAAKPILYAIADESKIIQENGFGLCCKAEATEEIASSLAKFYSMTSEELMCMGQAGKNWCIANQRVTNQIKKIITEINADSTNQVNYSF
jgi:glycosyltransferase involved in cell wall biosynthesis